MKFTVIEQVHHCVKNHAAKKALFYKKLNQWEAYTWIEYLEEIETAARALMHLGVTHNSTTTIIGFNRPEWFFANMASIFAGGAPAGIYTTNSPEQCLYITNHAEAKVVFVEDQKQLDKFLAVRDQLTTVKAIVMMEGESSQENVYSYKQFKELAQHVSADELKARTSEITEDQMATLVYTSGTTGNPKGVILSHKNLSWTARNIIGLLFPTSSDRCISYLPLSHIAEQVVSIHAPLVSGHSIYFAESIEQLNENLVEVRPTLFLGVPRVWEKIKDKISLKLSNAPFMKRKLFELAQRTGLAHTRSQEEHSKAPMLYPFFHKLLLSKVKKALGLDQCRFRVTAAAPISKSTLDFFSSIDLPICEIYGMSECTGPATISLPHKFKIGKAGYVLPGTEMKIAEDGEILMRGPHVFQGYFKNEAATKETIDEEGWLHSGDVGDIDERDFLQITDRKKDLIITAGGENIAPQMIENKLKVIKGISQSVVIGDKKKFLSVLLTLEDESALQVAAGLGIKVSSASELPANDDFRNYIHREIEEVNKSLARVQTIKKFYILGSQFSIESGELTPTMKIKRKVVLEKFKDNIESMYAMI